MMEASMIELRDIIVKYNAPTERIGTFKEYAIRVLQGRVKRADFLALNEVSLNIDKGQVFGVIGQNGAGKSTLLKVIARVLPPTSGRVIVRGWIAPLLELGAGFHPELTGRENIYLNGAILGFSRNDMTGLFDSIVEFSELGDFIEAPVRTYSSGMYARLAFSVATAVRPEVLLVDEILGVGDEAFQAKCYDRIFAYCAQGTTVVFVSHSMHAVKQICQKVAWIDHGKIQTQGEPDDVIDAYHDHLMRNRP
jgi:ABC-2 type transport system ATP-binding protein/lipopolysaccharide transport system ATP-binding protein